MTDDQELCAALTKNDRSALRTSVDAFLAAQGKAESARARVAALAAWLRSQSCITSVDLARDLKASEPPIQAISVTLSSGIRCDFGIRISQDRLYFDYR